MPLIRTQRGSDYQADDQRVPGDQGDGLPIRGVRDDDGLGAGGGGKEAEADRDEQEQAV